MLKLYEEQKKSLYQMQKDLDFSIVTLYRYAKNQRDVKNMPSEILIKLSNYLKINPKELYEKMVKYQAKNDKLQ